MIKLLALDMDGTLLNEAKEIPQAHIDAIHKAIEKGVKLVLCTGRPLLEFFLTTRNSVLICKMNSLLSIMVVLPTKPVIGALLTGGNLANLTSNTSMILLKRVRFN